MGQCDYFRGDFVETFAIRKTQITRQQAALPYGKETLNDWGEREFF